MANYYEQIRIKTATEGTHKRVMKGKTETSVDFGQFMPLRAKMLELGQGKIRPYTVSNMMPLPQPTFGEVIYTNRIFAVPIHTFFRGYEDYRQDNIHVTSDDTSTVLGVLPYTKNDDIVYTLMANSGPATLNTHDFAVDNNGTIQYFYYTEISAWWAKVLTTLGYKWIWRYGYSTDVGGISKNVLRILAIAKVYSDYYYNKAYRGDSDDLALREILNRDNGNLYYDSNDLDTILKTLHKVYYNMNYFTAAWDRPDTPNVNGQASTYTMYDPNGPIGANENRVSNDTGQDPYLNATQTGGTMSYTKPTQVALNMLKSLTMFLKRNQLAGGDTLARYLARYGVMNDDLKRKTARLIGTQKWSLNVSPIFSQADTAGQGGEVLGSYAGMGFAKKDEETFSYETNCDVIIVEILTVTPKESYVDGEDKENMILTKTELITPEFDNVGVDPVVAAELVMPRNQGAVLDTNNIYAKIFGWLPRYAYIKTMRDIMSGNYTMNPYATTYLPYTMTRRIDDNQAVTNIVHSKAFTKMNDSAQYDRIFYGQPNDKQPFDNINVYHELEIEWYSYAKPLYDNYDWEHEGGKEIEIQNQGNL